MKGSKICLYVPLCILLIVICTISPAITSLAHTYSSAIYTASMAQQQLAQQEQPTAETKHAQWHKLNELAEQALFLIRKNEFAAARNVVTSIEDALLNLELGDYVERLDQAKLLTETVIQTKYALNSIEPDRQAIERKALQMRLTLDAVSHTTQPLWLSLFPSVNKILNDMYKAIEEGNRDLFYQKMNELSNVYQLVRPALFISHKQGVVEQLDSQMAFLTQMNGERWKNKDQTVNVLRSFEQQIKMAFFQKQNQSLQSFIFLLIGITSIICGVLAYVAWRKYKGENETIPWKQISSSNKFDQL